MTFIEQLQFLERLDGLIHRKKTGSAKELAAHVGVSRSSLFNYFDILRTLGADIEHCEFRKTYYYVADRRPHLVHLSAVNAADD